MPTISKLVAAFAFAIVAAFAAELFKPQMPEGTQFGYFTVICAVIGLICGWRVMGNLVGRGYRAAMGYGLRTSVTLVVWAVLVCSIILMVKNSLRMRYDSPMEAIVGIFELGLENGARILAVEPMVALVVGGLLGGLIAEWARRRWE